MSTALRNTGAHVLACEHGKWGYSFFFLLLGRRGGTDHFAAAANPDAKYYKIHPSS